MKPAVTLWRKWKRKENHTDGRFNFFFFQFLFPDAADKLAEVFENRASTSAGNNPPPESEDYVSFVE